MFKCRILNAIKGSIFYTIHINQLHVNYTLTPKYPSGNAIQIDINEYTVKICCTSMQVKSSVQGFFFIKRGSALSVYIQCLTGADSTHLLLFLIANIDILLRSNSSLKKNYLKYSYSEKAIMVPAYILLEHKVPSCILGGTMACHWSGIL